MRYLLAFLALIANSLAQQTIFQYVPESASNQVQIEITSLYSQLYPGGFQPIRVTARNESKQPGTFTLNFRASTSNNYYGGAELTSTNEFSFELRPNEPITRDLLVAIPIGTEASCTGNLRVELNSSWGTHFGHFSSYHDEALPRLLMSDTLHNRNASELDAENRKISGRSYGNSNFAGSFLPAQLPEDWRAYSGVEGILLTNENWNALSSSARLALLQWNRLGGSLYLFGPLADRLPGLEDSENQTTSFRSLGLVTREPINTTNQLDAGATIKLVTPNIPTHSRALANDYSQHGSPFPAQISFGQKGFNYAFFLLILFIFAVFVGPINLFVFAKSSRRHRLFVTTPIISLAASLLMLVAILIQDGFGGKGHRVTLMEVCAGAGENQAYVIQEQFSRTGVLLGSSFTVSESSQVSPVVLSSSNPWARLVDHSNRNSGVRRYEAEITGEGTRHSGSWFQSRSEQGQVLRAVVPTRSRIEVRRDGDRWIGVSSFEAPLETLWCIVDQQYLTASQVQPGSNFEFRSGTAEEYEAFAKSQCERLAQRHSLLYRERLKLAPGRFAASSATLAIDSFSRIKWENSETLITGTCVTP